MFLSQNPSGHVSYGVSCTFHVISPRRRRIFRWRDSRNLAEPILSTPVIEYRNWNLSVSWMNSWCWPTTTSPNHAPSHQDTCPESLFAETASRMCCASPPIPSWGMFGCSQSHGFPLFLKENLVDSSFARISSPHRKSLYLRYHLFRYRRFHSSIQSPLSRDSLLFK